MPRHPLLLARLGLAGFRSARGLAKSRFRTLRARALFAGIAAHSTIPLEAPLSAAVGLVLGIAGHSGGWPMPRGGAQRISDALAGYFRSLGGEIRTASRLDSLPDAPLVLCDITPRQLLRISGDRFPAGFRRALDDYRYGPGAFKLDWALDAPIPWKAPACARAGTVHLGGALEEIAAWESHQAGAPFVLLAQHTLFDPSRAPAGRHTAWAYCHVPNGFAGDMTEAIESQVERFAPGFRRLSFWSATSSHRRRWKPTTRISSASDFNGGALDLRQFFFRPTRRLYGTPDSGVFLCGASTPPGGGVHGMCGFHAATGALDR